MLLGPRADSNAARLGIAIVVALLCGAGGCFGGGDGGDVPSLDANEVPALSGSGAPSGAGQGGAAGGDFADSAAAGEAAVGEAAAGAGAPSRDDAGSAATDAGVADDAAAPSLLDASWIGRDAGSAAVDAGVDASSSATPDTGAGRDVDAAAPGETGFMVGMTAAHNAVRASVETEPPLPPLTWSNELAVVAQDWADTLASTCGFGHSYGDYGENLAAFGDSSDTPESPAARAVEGWASELACYSFGTFLVGDACTSACDDSGGCGHYTQLVWRETERVGCGRAECEASGFFWEIWVCEYDPPGNVAGFEPY